MLVLVNFLTSFPPYWSSEWAVRVIVRFSGRLRGSLTAVSSCAALARRYLVCMRRFGHAGRRKRPHPSLHHSRPYANDTLSQTTSRKPYLLVARGSPLLYH